jgi:hypothetical protein
MDSIHTTSLLTIYIFTCPYVNQISQFRCPTNLEAEQELGPMYVISARMDWCLIKMLAIYTLLTSYQWRQLCAEIVKIWQVYLDAGTGLRVLDIK